MMRCPCGGSYYQKCCQPLHDFSVVATDAQRLMQSRFSAFYLKNIDYIIKTTVPAQQNLLDKSALQSWADQTRWTNLMLIRHTPKVDKRHAQVHFKAYFYDGDKECCHDELSSFVEVDDRWYFLDPTVPTDLTNKQPCLCGSGEKFKVCCKKFLA